MKFEFANWSLCGLNVPAEKYVFKTRVQFIQV